MKGGKKFWLIVWLLAILLLAGEFYFLFTANSPVDWSTKILSTLIGGIALVEIRLLQGEGPIFRKLGWILGGLLLMLLVPQFLAAQSILILWNFTLAVLALLSGLLMFAMVGKSRMARAFVIFLTLCVCLLMILEFTSPLVHKIALGIFVSGALICIHVMTTARSN